MDVAESAHAILHYQIACRSILSSVSYTHLIGEYEITASGADAGDNYTIKYVHAKLTVLTDNAVDAAKGYDEELKDYNPDTVTSDDKAELEEMLGEIDTILDDDDITDNGKKALEETKDKVKDLLEKIDDADKSTETEKMCIRDSSRRTRRICNLRPGRKSYCSSHRVARASDHRAGKKNERIRF